MKFTIIIPTYNREHCIDRAITSVQNQTFTDFECLIVDDGSIDNTKALCKNVTDIDSRFSYFFKENGDVSSGRNFGIEKANGDYILFLDSDDELEKDTLFVINDIISSSDQTINTVCFGMKGWNPASTICGRTITRDEIANKLMPVHLEIIPKNDFLVRESSCNKCYRRQMLIDNNIRFPQNRKLWEDGIFVTNVLKHTKSLYVVNNQFYLNGDSGLDDHLSSNANENAIFAMIDNWNYYYDKYHQEYDFNSNYAKWFYFSCICDILKKCMQNYTEEVFEKLLIKLFDDKTFNYLLKKFAPNGIKERDYKKALKTQNITKIRRAFSSKSQTYNRLDKLTRKIDFKIKGIKA